MMSPRLRSREHQRMLERLVALAEAYGCTELEALEADVDVVLRVEYLFFQRRVRTADEMARRRVGTKCQHEESSSGV
jgi:hypothetical protein